MCPPMPKYKTPKAAWFPEAAFNRSEIENDFDRLGCTLLDGEADDPQTRGKTRIFGAIVRTQEPGFREHPSYAGLIAMGGHY
jgi:hypothetical protein